MVASKEICISSSIYTSSSPILFVSRFWGIAPYLIRKEGRNYILKLSLAYTVYSYFLCLIFVYGSLQGMVSNMSVQRAKGEFVAYFGVTLGNIVTIALIFGAPLRTSKLYSYIKCMNKIDSILEVKDSKKARYVSIVALSIIFCAITMQVSASMYFMAVINPIFILHFLPDNVQQTFVLIMYECQYAHMVYCVQRRIKIINDSLEINDNSQLQEKEMQSNFRLLNTEDFKIDQLDTKLQMQFNGQYGLKLAKVYSLLCDAVDHINALFSYKIVMIITSGLLKVTESMYFVIFMILQKYPVGSIITQVFWVFFHICRLCILVEPCDRCLREINKTSIIVSKLLGLNNNNHNLKTQMEILLRHLQHRKFEFSVYGLGTLNHKFLTSFMSAVTTYLVIIIQFNQSFNR